MDKSNWTIQSLKEHYDTILNDKKLLDDERNKRIDEQFKSQQLLYQTVQSASNLAISKSEAAQNTYNVGHNDLSKKMEAQYKDMMPRTEADARFANLEDKLNEERKINAALTARLDLMAGAVSGKKESHENIKDFRDWIPWLISIAMFLLYIYNLKK